MMSLKRLLKKNQPSKFYWVDLYLVSKFKKLLDSFYHVLNNFFSITEDHHCFIHIE